jgi:hypothetical protein
VTFPSASAPDPSVPGPNGAPSAPASLPPSPQGALPSVPPTIPTPVPQPPGTPQVPPPPTITKQSTIAARQPADKIKNPFERVATMLVDASEQYAKRLAGNLSEQPADSVEADAQTVHEMMHFSPYGVDAPRVFWQMHDQILQEAAKSGDPDPYAAAERGALDAVYPSRAKLALLDVLGPEEKVKRAEMLMDMSHRQIAKGHTPESMPFNVGPKGLPHDQASMPSTNGHTNGSAAY